MLFPNHDAWTLAREISIGALYLLAFAGGMVVWRRLCPQRVAIVRSLRRRARRFW
jgi:hypothetical protein